MALNKRELRPLVQYSPEEWLKLTQREQLECYNTSVYNLRILLSQLNEVMAHVKDVRRRLEAKE